MQNHTRRNSGIGYLSYQLSASLMELTLVELNTDVFYDGKIIKERLLTVKKNIAFSREYSANVTSFFLSLSRDQTKSHKRNQRLTELINQCDSI